MIYKLFDDKGELAYTGSHWLFTRRYLEYLSSTCVGIPHLEVSISGREDLQALVEEGLHLV